MGSVTSPEMDRRSPGAGAGAAKTADVAMNATIKRKVDKERQETSLVRIENPLYGSSLFILVFILVPKLNLGTRPIDTYLGNSTGIPMRGQIT
jgi:hypothetical protein